MRPLTLHVSALSDSEYDLYTVSLHDLTTDSTDNNASFVGTSFVRDDAYYEQASVGAREARAWLRGRYSDLPASEIDAILKFFCPNMLPSDTLTGGQFFAALRLVVHAKSGRGVDRSLAFVQASPKVAKTPDVPRPHSPPKRPVQAPPSHPDRQKALLPAVSSQETNPFTRRSVEHATGPIQPPDPETMPVLPHQRSAKLSHNPFLARDKADSGADKTAPSSVNAPNHGKLPPLPPRKPSLLAAPPRRPSEAVPTPVTSTANLMTPLGPPVIPLKPTHVMSPIMRQSLEASKHAQSMKRAEEQLDRERVLQVLKSTPSSSSVGATISGTRTRSLSPAKQPSQPSNGHGPGPEFESRASDDATYVPPLPRRRNPSQHSSSASSSALSLEQVASAKLPSPVGPPPFRPPLPSRDVHVHVHAHAHAHSMSAIHPDNAAAVGPGSGVIPPPTHPHRRTSTSTEPTVNDTQPSPSPSPSLPRVARSKSVASSSASAPPPVPPPRKRPESMQLTTATTATEEEIEDLPSAFQTAPWAWGAHATQAQARRTASHQGLSRHLSLTRRERRRGDTSASGVTPTPSPIANIQRTLSNLQLKAQPKLEAVRYKAEAGISRRGYVPHHGWREEGERGLMADARWAITDVDRDLVDSAPTTDDDDGPSSGEDRSQGESGSRGTHRATSPSRREFLTQSDNLKWPVGEGWRPL